MSHCHWPASSSVRTKGERTDGAHEALGGGVRIYSGDKGGGLIEKQVRGEEKGFVVFFFFYHSFGFFTTE